MELSNYILAALTSFSQSNLFANLYQNESKLLEIRVRHPLDAWYSPSGPMCPCWARTPYMAWIDRLISNRQGSPLIGSISINPRSSLPICVYHILHNQSIVFVPIPVYINQYSYHLSVTQRKNIIN